MPMLKTHPRYCEYRTWIGMRSRCYNPKHVAFKDYGGRGIIVCDRWRWSFANFFSDMGARPTDRPTIERKDTNGNYEPQNCEWQSRKVQSSNRRDTRFVNWRGRLIPRAQCAHENGIPVNIFTRRLDYGWSIEEAASTPYTPGKRAITDRLIASNRSNLIEAHTARVVNYGVGHIDKSEIIDIGDIACTCDRTKEPNPLKHHGAKCRRYSVAYEIRRKAVRKAARQERLLKKLQSQSSG